MSTPTTTTTTGGWVETVAPGVSTDLDPTTMPHALISEADGTFTFQKLSWTPRSAGDDVTCPVPSFVGQKMNDVFFARNRLGFLTGQNVVLSHAGGQYYNFFRDHATQVVDGDYIDVASTDKDIAIMTAALPLAEDVVVFSGKTQFRLTSGQDLMTAKTVELRPLSKYENYGSCPPVVAGSSIIYDMDRGEASAVCQYDLDLINSRGVSTELTEHCPRYVPRNLYRLDTCDSERLHFALSLDDPYGVYVYGWFNSGEERLQSSWSRWDWGADKVLDLAVFGSDLAVLIQRPDGLYIEALTLSTSQNDQGANYVTHLDRRVIETQCTATFDAAANQTTITVPYTLATADWPNVQMWERLTTGSNRLPRQQHISIQGTNQILVLGDWTHTPFFIGLTCPSEYVFSTIFMRDMQGNSRDDGRLQLRRLALNYARTGGFEVQVRDTARNPLPTQVDLQAFQAAAYSCLQGFQVPTICPPGVSLALGQSDFANYQGAINGAFQGVAADGRYEVSLLSAQGDDVRLQLQPDASFSTPTMPDDLVVVRLIRVADDAVVFEQPLITSAAYRYLLVNDQTDLFTGQGRLQLNPRFGSSLGTSMGGYLLASHLPADTDVSRAARLRTCEVYAQAMAILAACVCGNSVLAERWAWGLASLCGSDGSLCVSYDRATLSPIDTDKPLADQAWAVTAFNGFMATFPGSEIVTQLTGVRNLLLALLKGQLLPTGLFPGGVSDNLAMYLALKTAGDPLAATLAASIKAQLWDSTHGRLSDDPNTLAPEGSLVLQDAGFNGLAQFHERWSQYFHTTRAYTRSVTGLDAQGVYAEPTGRIWAEGTAWAAIAKLVIGDRASARQIMAELSTFIGPLGMPYSAPRGEDGIEVWPSVAATALAVLSLNPSGFLGLTGDPLWQEGTVAVAPDMFNYRVAATAADAQGQFVVPVSARNLNVEITLKSLDALPFSFLSASWEGNFTTRNQRMPG